MISNTTELAITITHPQRSRALAKANAVRLARAALKRRIQTGELTAAEVILECPPAARSWPIGELLLSQRRWGATRCQKFLARHEIAETKTIGSLTERQRRLLALALSASSKPARKREMALV